MSEKMFCPFCGGELYLEVDEEAGGVGLYHAWDTRCIMPDIESIDDMPIGSTLDDLIVRINARPIEAALRAEVKRLREALEYYASPKIYDSSDGPMEVEIDGGENACNALKGGEG